MISIFTPSHDPQYLDQCYESLTNQSYQNWEWIVILNGNAEWTPPPDSRVLCTAQRSLTGKVGALKAHACSLAEGSILLELDHDDILLPNALAQVCNGFDNNPTVGLVYSDSAQVNADLSRNEERYADGNGWEYYDTEDNYMAISAQPITPHTISYIWYAPNHLRAFRRSTYLAVGGYNQSLTVCDDIDLMVRMYRHSPFHHIPQCLYLQRLHDNNTQRDAETNALIQRETVRIYDENIQPNALTWAQRNQLPCYDLGGAHNSPEGYIPIDIELGTEVLTALSQMNDDSIGIIRAVDFLEHVYDKVRLMNEIYRVLAPGGMLLSLTPSTDGRGAFCDPTHVSFWNSLSFRYYCDPEYQKYVPSITARFRQSRLYDHFPTQWHQDNIVPYVCFNGTKDPQ